MKYCIQCTDAITGQIGSFGYIERHPATGQPVAATPVFNSLAELFNYARDNGITLESEVQS